MKETISITTIFQIVILFILLFTAIMALTINNSNAFGVKDQLVNYIEVNNGDIFDDNGNLKEDIVNIINETSYRTTGKCDEDYEGYSRTGELLETDQKASVCIRVVEATKGVDDYLNKIFEDKVAQEDFMEGKYYQIAVFFQLDLPVVKQVYDFKSKAETKMIYNANR